MEKHKNKQVGLVLSAGGAVGWPQIGVVQKLLEWKVPIDIVVGASIGAFWGAAIAAGMPIKEIVKKGKEYKGSDFWTFNLETKCGLLDPRKVMEKWASDCGDLQFEKLPKKLCIVATDFETGEEIILTSGSVARAVQASFADPPLSKPVEIEGRFLVDGALVNPLPVDVAYKLGADVVVAVDGIGENFGKLETVYRKRAELGKILMRVFPNTALQIVLQRSGIMEGLGKRVGITMAEIKKCKLKICPPDVWIRIGRDGLAQWDQFDSSDENKIAQLIEEGRMAAGLQKENIFKTLGGSGVCGADKSAP